LDFAVAIPIVSNPEAFIYLPSPGRILIPFNEVKRPLVLFCFQVAFSTITSMSLVNWQFIHHILNGFCLIHQVFKSHFCFPFSYGCSAAFI
jgi:hypothetical protein